MHRLTSLIERRVVFAVLLAMFTFTTRPANAQTTFTVVNNAFSSYKISGADNPTLNLQRGQTYLFNVTSPGHPFYIKTAQVTGTGSTFDTGVTNNGVTSGTLNFTVPAGAPATLFYQCSVHAAMTGTLAITGAAAPAVSPGYLALLLLLMAALAIWLLRDRMLASAPTQRRGES